MNKLFKPVVEVIRELSSTFPELEMDFNKIKKTLRNYSTSEGKKLSELPLIDICDKEDCRQPEPALLAHTRKTLDERYRRETVSRIKKILRICFKAPENDQESLPEDSDIPPLLQKMLVTLPRDYSGVKIGTPTAIKLSPEFRRTLPLTQKGRLLRQTILAVFNEDEIPETMSLVDLIEEKLYPKIGELYGRNMYARLRHILYLILKRLSPGPIRKKSRAEIAYQNLSQKLKQQCETFEQMALGGIDDNPQLQRLAALKGIQLRRISKRTVEKYLLAFKIMVSKLNIKCDENMDITSFLKIEMKKTFDETGLEVNYPYNPLVEEIRDITRKKSDRIKEAGYDSATFMNFLFTIKAIAAFNGIFSYHESFSRVYRARLDKRTKEKRKNKKRRVYDWVFFDREIERLFIEFKKIIDDKSFIDDRTVRSKQDSNENLRKCIFFVALVMLRYLGVRQQLLRNCIVGENIVFAEGGRINFYWCEELNKNKVELYGYFDPLEHAGTHGTMIEVVNLYYKEIYPYTKEIALYPNDKQLLCCLNPSGKTRPFDRAGNGDFTDKFSRWAYFYLKTEDREKDCEDRIHPQLLRSLCVNWLRKEHGVSDRNSASFIGDTERTMKTHYADRVNSHNLNDALDEAKMNKQKKEQQTNAETSDFLAKMLKKSMKKVTSLEAENRKLKRLLKKAA